MLRYKEDDFVEEEEIDVTEPTKKLNYPFDEQIQEKLTAPIKNTMK